MRLIYKQKLPFLRPAGLLIMTIKLRTK